MLQRWVPKTDKSSGPRKSILSGLPDDSRLVVDPWQPDRYYSGSHAAPQDREQEHAARVQVHREQRELRERSTRLAVKKVVSYAGMSCLEPKRRGEECIHTLSRSLD